MDTSNSNHNPLAIADLFCLTLRELGFSLNDAAWPLLNMSAVDTAMWRNHAPSAFVARLRSSSRSRNAAERPMNTLLATVLCVNSETAVLQHGHSLLLLQRQWDSHQNQSSFLQHLGQGLGQKQTALETVIGESSSTDQVDNGPSSTRSSHKKRDSRRDSRGGSRKSKRSASQSQQSRSQQRDHHDGSDSDSGSNYSDGGDGDGESDSYSDNDRVELDKRRKRRRRLPPSRPRPPLPPSAAEDDVIEVDPSSLSAAVRGLSDQRKHSHNHDLDSQNLQSEGVSLTAERENTVTIDSTTTNAHGYKYQLRWARPSMQMMHYSHSADSGSCKMLLSTAQKSEPNGRVLLLFPSKDEKEP